MLNRLFISINSLFVRAFALLRNNISARVKVLFYILSQIDGEIV